MTKKIALTAALMLALAGGANAMDMKKPMHKLLPRCGAGAVKVTCVCHAAMSKAKHVCHAGQWCHNATDGACTM
jgi:hypothetical protein